MLKLALKQFSKQIGSLVLSTLVFLPIGRSAHAAHIPESSHEKEVEKPVTLTWYGLGLFAEGANFEVCARSMTAAGAQVKSVMNIIGIVSFSIPFENLSAIKDLQCIAAIEKEGVMSSGGVAGVSN